MRTCTYTRDSFTGLDYADQRFYASTYGRFNTADPYQASGGPSDPSSWNRYSYTEGDPVNRSDPSGLMFCAAEFESCDGDVSSFVSGVSNTPGCPGFLAGMGYVGIPGPGCYAAAPIAMLLAPPPEINCSDANVELLSTLGQSGTAILQTVFGEDSWNFIGTGSYKDGEAYSRKGGSGDTITKGDVASEITYMADVILNRATSSGKSVGDVVSAPNQFLGYTLGLKPLAQAYSSNVGSNECDHLVTAATAIAGQLRSVDHKDVRSWRAVQQGNPGRARTRRPGDIRIANTDFF